SPTTIQRFVPLETGHPEVALVYTPYLIQATKLGRIFPPLPEGRLGGEGASIEVDPL
ncbi:MAG: hypothetical protein CEO40_242, partial [Parcubacteria group bacterium LiPW_72]